MPSSSIDHASAKLYKLSQLCAVLNMTLCCWSNSAQSAQAQSVHQQGCDVCLDTGALACWPVADGTLGVIVSCSHTS